MRKHLLILLAAFLVAVSASAQTPTVTGTALPSGTKYQSKLAIQAAVPCGTTEACFYDVWRTDGTCASANPNVAAWQKVGSTKPNVLVYLDPTVTQGNTYCYAVESDFNGGVSDPSNLVQVVIPVPLPAPVVQGTASPQ